MAKAFTKSQTPLSFADLLAFARTQSAEGLDGLGFPDSKKGKADGMEPGLGELARAEHKAHTGSGPATGEPIKIKVKVKVSAKVSAKRGKKVRVVQATRSSLSPTSPGQSRGPE